MNKRIDFSEFLEPIKPGEYEAKQVLRRAGEKVIDVSENPIYWKKDIDLIVKDNNSTQWGIEVKWDSRISETGNLYLEYYNENSINNKGWLLFSEADIIFYGDSVNKCFYLFYLNDLKKYVNENKDQIKETSIIEHKNYKSSISRGYLVSLNEISHLLIKKVEI